MKRLILITVFLISFTGILFAEETNLDFYVNNYQKYKHVKKFNCARIESALREKLIETQVERVLGKKISFEDFVVWERKNQAIPKEQKYGSAIIISVKPRIYDAAGLDICVKRDLLKCMIKPKGLKLRSRLSEWEYDVLTVKLFADTYGGEPMFQPEIDDKFKQIQNCNKENNEKEFYMGCAKKYYPYRKIELLGSYPFFAMWFAELLGNYYYDNPERMIELWEIYNEKMTTKYNDALEYIEIFNLSGKITPEFRAEFNKIMERKKREHEAAVQAE